MRRHPEDRRDQAHQARLGLRVPDTAPQAREIITQAGGRHALEYHPSYVCARRQGLERKVSCAHKCQHLVHLSYVIVDTDRVEAEAVDHHWVLAHTELSGEGGKPRGDVDELRPLARHVEGAARGGVTQGHASPALIHPGIPGNKSHSVYKMVSYTRHDKCNAEFMKN